MVNDEQRAQALILEAEKKLNSSKSFFGSLFGGSTKIEDVADCYLKAGNLFKIIKKWASAGEAYFEAANLHSKTGSRHEAATSYVDAAICYKKSDLKEAIICFLRAIDIYTDLGRFSTAAKHHLNIAEIYEINCINLEKAIQHYEQAADYYRGEDNNSSANKCFLKVAHYTAQLENYEKAIDIYEKVATFSMDNSLLKYSAKEYLFRALLCHLCVDILNAQHAISKYILMYPAFQDTRELKLIQSLVKYFEEQNVIGFTDAVKYYDSISRFDPWYTMMLLRIKKTLNKQPDLR